MRRLLLLAAAALLGGAAPVSALQATTQPRNEAEEARIERQTHELASQLRCPVCQGLSINDSPTELSQEMRDVIEEQLRAGKTPDEVKEYFVSKYGEWILLSPEPTGLNWAVYLLPVAAVLAGIGVVVLAVRRWIPPRPPSAETVEETAEAEYVDTP